MSSNKFTKQSCFAVVDLYLQNMCVNPRFAVFLKQHIVTITEEDLTDEIHNSNLTLTGITVKHHKANLLRKNHCASSLPPTPFSGGNRKELCSKLQ